MPGVGSALSHAGAVDTLVAIRRPKGNHRDSIRSIQAISRFEGVPDELMVELTPLGYVALQRGSDVILVL